MTTQSSTKSDGSQPAEGTQPDSPRAPLHELYTTSPEPVRIPVGINGNTIDLYAIPSSLAFADGEAVAQQAARPTPSMPGFIITGDRDPHDWDQLVVALGKVESVLDIAPHERIIRRAVDRCADTAANEGWTLEQFMARFHAVIKLPAPPTDPALGSMLHALQARFITKVLDWGVERFFIASELRAKDVRERGHRSA